VCGLEIEKKIKIKGQEKERVFRKTRKESGPCVDADGKRSMDC
jgi:hypothetical protein